jgi:hypothetical protein
MMVLVNEIIVVMSLFLVFRVLILLLRYYDYYC